MPITLRSSISELGKSVPSFSIDPEWEQENLSYLVFSDFARYICSEAEVLQYVGSDDEAHRLSDVPTCMQFLEHALEEGDFEVHDLIVDCVETLSECQFQQQINKWAGPRVSAIWRRQI
jgi:hypothetical protein